MLNGWIKLHRKILDHWCASEPDSLAVWIRLLAEANHKEKKKRFNGTLTTIKRGQLIFGLNAFSEKSGVSISKLRRILKDLEIDGMINRQKTNKYSLITITCFDDYQGDDSQTSSKRQASDNQTATPKECKNDKECKESMLSKEFDTDRIIPIWNSLGCKQHRGLTDKASKSLDKTYNAYCKSIKKPDKPKEINDWLEAYLIKGFGEWMTNHHRQMNDGQWAADLEFAVRYDTYDKIKNTVKE